MTLQDMTKILNKVGIQASAGKSTMIIRDINANIAMCEFISSDKYITTKVMRLDRANEFTISNDRTKDFELLDLLMDVAGGIA